MTQIIEVDETNLIISTDDVEGYLEFSSASINSGTFEDIVRMSISQLENILQRFLTEKLITESYSVRSLIRGRHVIGGSLNEIISNKFEGETLTTNCEIKGDNLIWNIDNVSLEYTDVIEVTYKTGYTDETIPREIKSWLTRLVASHYLNRIDSDENFDNDKSTKGKVNLVDDVLKQAKKSLGMYRAAYYVN